MRVPCQQGMNEESEFIGKGLFELVHFSVASEQREERDGGGAVK